MLQCMTEHMLCPVSENSCAFLKLVNKPSGTLSVGCNGKARSIKLAKRTHVEDGVTTVDFELMRTAMVGFQRAMDPLDRALSVSWCVFLCSKLHACGQSTIGARSRTLQATAARGRRVCCRSYPIHPCRQLILGYLVNLF